MFSPDLSVIKTAIQHVESKVFRDFHELEELQNSVAVMKFATMTVEKLKNDFFEHFVKSRPTAKIVVKDGKTHEGSKGDTEIYINCISGIKNFVHAIPYFATIIGIKKNGKFVTALVNNYATQEMFTVEGGSGAYLNGKRMRVSTKNNMASVILGIKYDASKQKFIDLLEHMKATFKINNCSILDACHTASGKLDGGIVFECTKEEAEIIELFTVESGGLFNFINEEKTSCFYSNSLIHNNIKQMLGIL